MLQSLIHHFDNQKSQLDVLEASFSQKFKQINENKPAKKEKKQ
jgi:hypothetical protein